MKKRITKIVALTLIAGSMLSVTASARSIGTFTNFELPSWKGTVYTIYRPKQNNSKSWILNVENLLNCKKVMAGLVNSENKLRSTYEAYGKGRQVIDTTAVKGYEYKAKLASYNFSISDGYLNGSWSPDDVQ